MIQGEVRSLAPLQTRESIGPNISSELTQSSIRSYLLNTNVQLGATYETSKVSTAAFDNAYKIAADFINAKPEEVSNLWKHSGYIPCAYLTNTTYLKTS